MKREELKEILKDLNPADEVINRIMAANDNDINSVKEQLGNDVAALKNQLAERDKDIEQLKSTPNNTEELTKQLEQLQAKYETDTKALQSQIDSRNYRDAVKSAIADKGIRFTSKAAESYYISQAENKKLKLENGKLTGFDEFHNEQYEADKGAFIVEEQPDKGNSGKAPTFTFSGPTGSGDKNTQSYASLAAQRFNSNHGVPAPTNANTK